MGCVVFLRGVNVGGHKAFKPSALAKALAEFDVVNVGAAGTFVVRGSVANSVLRAELRRRLPFDSELMICPSRDILKIEMCNTFPTDSAGQKVARFASILAKRPRTLPPLPITQPVGEDWQVKIIAVTGKFALSLHRRMGRTLVYPNQVVEKKLGVSATTRNWNTIAAICDILKQT